MAGLRGVTLIGRSAMPDKACVIIVGAGLSGLVAAWWLQQQGVANVVLLEARERLGGRVLSVNAEGAVAEVLAGVDSASDSRDAFDLGPSWFWPAMQPQLDELVNALELERFEQHDQGDWLIERSAHQAPVRVGGVAASPASMRLAGSTSALIAALAARLRPQSVFLGVAVRRLRRLDDHVQIECQTAAGDPITWLADHVMLALPPRLAVRRIDFDPPLPEGLARRWHSTETWMAPHAKYVAIYPSPFWREQGLCGAARSSVGPMVEIHDASTPAGHAALFGFLGVPATSRRRVNEAVLRQHCRAQLGRLFGERAAHPTADAIKDWAFDPLTAAEEDMEASGHHPEAPPAEPDCGPWLGLVQGIGSEWSPEFAGYLAGAVDAAQRGVLRWLGRASGPK